MSEQPASLWSFGYGSNMDTIALEKKKHVKILEHTPAILKDFKMMFGSPGMTWVEPAYASITPKPGSEVHGVAFLMTQESLAELNETERGYNQAEVALKAYDGRDLHGFVYAPKNGWPEHDLEPSKRYLDVVLKGAKQAGLKAEYIAQIEAHPTYSPPEWLIQLRKSRPNPTDLKAISVAELAEHNDPSHELWVSCLGYVVRPKSQWALGAHRGRDVTSRVLMQYHGIPLDDNDDRGKPPYPLVNALRPEELEYITRWLDFYQASKSEDGTQNLGEIVGYLTPFLEQQVGGKSTFKLPPVPQ